MNEMDKIIAFLKYLGIRIDMNVFGDRKLLQKLVYLFQELGLLSNRYRFTIYLQGPYSPELAKEGFENKLKLINFDTTYATSENEKKILYRIRSSLRNWLINTDKMELVTSIILLKKEYGKKWKEKLKQIKPRFSDEKILVAEQRIKELFFDEDSISESMRNELESWNKMSGDLVE